MPSEHSGELPCRRVGCHRDRRPRLWGDLRAPEESKGGGEPECIVAQDRDGQRHPVHGGQGEVPRKPLNEKEYGGSDGPSRH